MTNNRCIIHQYPYLSVAVAHSPKTRSYLGTIWNNMDVSATETINYIIMIILYIETVPTTMLRRYVRHPARVRVRILIIL